MTQQTPNGKATLGSTHVAFRQGQLETLPVAIIGAGPIGLAAAAHLIQRGETPILFEAGAEIAAGVRSWGHVHLFSPWRWCVDQAAVALLEAHGWQQPDPE